MASVGQQPGDSRRSPPLPLTLRAIYLPGSNEAWQRLDVGAIAVCCSVLGLLQNNGDRGKRRWADITVVTTSMLL